MVVSIPFWITPLYTTLTRAPLTLSLKYGEGFIFPFSILKGEGVRG